MEISGMGTIKQVCVMGVFVFEKIKIKEKKAEEGNFACKSDVCECMRDICSQSRARHRT
jgi:hypothetical protein